MSTQSGNAKWLSVDPCPILYSFTSVIMSTPLVLNNNELFVIPYTDSCNSLYKYNIKDNKGLHWKINVDDILSI